MKLIKISEAAERLGVSRQTLENWGKAGVIQIKKMGKTTNADWVDEDTINALSDTIVDVEHARIALEQEKADIEASYRTIHEKAKELRREVFMVNRFGQMCVSREFYLAIPGMLESLDILNEREGEIMRCIIGGDNYEELGDRFGLTRERVRQIFFRGCRKAHKLGNIKGCLQENSRLKSENEELKSCLRLMREELKAQQEDGGTSGDEDTDNKRRLFNVRLRDCDLSVRTLNCLIAADVETVGDLCRYRKSDLLRFRNLGKRSLGELEDFLESLGICFGMDVDRICMKSVIQHL